MKELQHNRTKDFLGFHPIFLFLAIFSDNTVNFFQNCEFPSHKTYDSINKFIVMFNVFIPEISFVKAFCKF